MGLPAKTSTLCLGDAMPQTGMPAILTNNRNRLSNATYDSAGNITQEYGAGFSYDAEGRLTNGSGSAYTYDGMGERVAKPGKLYWKGVGSTALVETDTNDLNPTKYIFFNGARIARIDPGTTTAKYYVTDNIGSTALVTDANGNVLNESLFFPYGVERVITQNDSANNYKFSGKERDSETGLDDFGARYYDSALGRFMTPDWDAKATAVPYAAFGDPQTLNLYAYVENGPLNKVDADGHSPELNWTSTCLEAGVGSLCGGTGCGTDAPIGMTILANIVFEAEQDAQSGQSDTSKPQVEKEKFHESPRQLLIDEITKYFADNHVPQEWINQAATFVSEGLSQGVDPRIAAAVLVSETGGVKYAKGSHNAFGIGAGKAKFDSDESAINTVTKILYAHIFGVAQQTTAEKLYSGRGNENGRIAHGKWVQDNYAGYCTSGCDAAKFRSNVRNAGANPDHLDQLPEP